MLYSLSDDDGVSWSDPQPFPRDPKVKTVIRHPISELNSKQWLVSLWDRTFVFDPATSKAAPFGDGRVHGLIPIVQTPKGTFVSGECVVDYSLRTKHQYHRNGGPAIWVAGYSNDVFGYLPTLRVLKEGGYEGGGHMVYTKFPGPFTEAVESRVFETIDRLVKEVR